jgi:hypothetical protein
MSNISNALDEDSFVKLQKLSVIVSSENRAVTTHELLHRGSPTPVELAKRWYTGLHSAKRTLERATQRGIRDFTKSEGTC